MRRAGSAGRAEVLARWSAARGDPVDWSAAPEILRNTLRRALHPWNGFYLDAQREISLFLLGRPDAGARDRVYLNGCLLAGVRYENGQIRWRAEAGNPSSGQLRVDISPRRARRLIGAVWPAGETPASHHRLTALEHVLPANSPLAVLAGDYRSKDAAGREIEVVLRAEHDDSGGRIMRALIDGRPAAGCVTIGRAGITIDGLEVPFSGLVRGTGIPTRFQGGYLVRMRNGSDTRLRRWSLGDNGIAINGYSTVAAERRGAGFTWADGPAELTEGEVTPLLDPITLKPMLFGSGRATDGQAVVSLVGMVPLTDREARALAARPGFGVPFWAWAHLAAIAVGASRAGGLFLWHGWVKAATNLRRVNAILNEARP